MHRAKYIQSHKILCDGHCCIYFLAGVATMKVMCVCSCAFQQTLNDFSVY